MQVCQGCMSESEIYRSAVFLKSLAWVFERQQHATCFIKTSTDPTSRMKATFYFRQRIAKIGTAAADKHATLPASQCFATSAPYLTPRSSSRNPAERVTNAMLLDHPWMKALTEPETVTKETTRRAAMHSPIRG